jgi:hypothetical protein
MPHHIEFVAVMGYDMVGAELPGIPEEKKNQRKKILQNCLFESSTYQTLSSYANWIDTGDGGYLTVDTKDSDKLLEITKEMHDKLEIHNRTEKNKDWHIKIRVGVNVGPAEVTREVHKIIKVAGNAIAYTERITNLGEEDHILLTSSATTTILAIDHTYHDKIKYVGERTIKHGERFNVHNYIDGRYGNKKDPPPDPPALPEHQSSPYLKYSVVGLVCIIAVAGIFFGITNYEMTEYVSELQIEKAERIILGELVEVLDLSNVVTYDMVLSEYETHSVNNVNEFIHQNLQQKLEKLSLFQEDSRYSIEPLAAVILADRQCEYVVYGHIEDIGRKDGKQTPWCSLQEEYDLFLTDPYPSTAMNIMVSSIGRTVNVDGMDKDDAVLIFLIDERNLCASLNEQFVENDVEFVLVNGRDEIIFDTGSKDCKTSVNGSEPLDKDSRPQVFVESEYNILKTDAIFASIYDMGTKYNKNLSTNDWMLYMYK